MNADRSGQTLRESGRQAWQRARRLVRPWPGDGLPWALGWRWLAGAGVLLLALVGGVLPYVVPGAYAPSAVTWPLPGAAKTPAMAPGTRFRDCQDDSCPWLVVVPAGRFLMGSPETEEGRSTYEGPQHWVNIKKPLAVMQTEVTVGMFQKFAKETNYEEVGEACYAQIYKEKKYKRIQANWERPFGDESQVPQQPVVCVNWHDAQSFAQWMSRRTGQLYRLLSESEWEYVARAGTETPYWWGRDVGEGRANCGRCGGKWDGKEIAPVASFEANPFGLYDTSGNAWEWVQDCGEDYSTSETNGEAVETNLKLSCINRVVRGGGWNSNTLTVRAAYRVVTSSAPTYRDNSIGFRLARMLP